MFTKPMVTSEDISLLMSLSMYNTIMPDEREAVKSLRDRLDAMLDPDEEDEDEDDDLYAGLWDAFDDDEDEYDDYDDEG